MTVAHGGAVSEVYVEVIITVDTVVEVLVATVDVLVTVLVVAMHEQAEEI